MRKKLAVAVVVIIALAATAFIAWQNEWFVSTPASVLKQSLMQANAGNYEAACQDLWLDERDELLGNPQLMRKVWDRITKKRSIDSVQVIREDRGIDGRWGNIDITIKYLDGSTISARTEIICLAGRWRFAYATIRNAALAKDPEGEFDELRNGRIVVPQAYSHVGNSGVLLRVPEGVIWDRAKQAYRHPTYNFVIQVGGQVRGNFSTLVDFADKEWKKPTRSLERREDLSHGKVKAILFDGDGINEKGRGWRHMDLVIGDERQTTLISTVLPNLDNCKQAMRECLTTARWEPARE